VTYPAPVSVILFVGGFVKRISLSILVILCFAGVVFAENHERRIVDQFDYRGIDQVVVSNAGIVHVEVYGGDSGKVSGIFSSEFPRDFKLRHEKRGNTLYIRITKRKSRFRWNIHGTVLELAVPRCIDLDLETSIGSITVEYIKGNTRLRCSTGIIEVAEYEGNIQSSTTTGGQNYFDCIGRISSYCTTGRIFISDFTGELDLDTTTGNQRGEYIELTGDSTFKATTGVVRMDFLNPKDELSFDLGTTIGSIRLNDIRSKERLLSGRGRIKIYSRTTTGAQSFYTN
jgi:hypothetical protein